MKRSKITRVALTPEDYREIAVYAQVKLLDVPSFLRFAGKQYMERYPVSEAKKDLAARVLDLSPDPLSGVHPDGLGGN